MKKGWDLLLVIFLLVSSFLSDAQNNLEFNRVILLKDTMNVPQGKVWKIESVLQAAVTSSNQPPTNLSSICGLIIDNVYVSSLNFAKLYYSYSGGNGASQAAAATGFDGSNLPIWLPAGTSVGRASNSAGISIIEYNVVTQ